MGVYLVRFEVVLDEAHIALEVGKPYSFWLPTTRDDLEGISDLFRITLESRCSDELHSMIRNRLRKQYI